MLHPDGLYAEQSLGPGDGLKRAAKLHSTLAQRRSQSLARLDALLEILGPAWHAAIGADLANRTPLKVLAAGYADPRVVKRLGRTRLARFCYRHSRGAWGEPRAAALFAAASETLELWSGGDVAQLVELGREAPSQTCRSARPVRPVRQISSNGGANPSMTTEASTVIGGVDTPTSTPTTQPAVDQHGRLLGHQEFPATDRGYHRLLAWMRRHSQIRAIGG
jgi:hypothetical protein